MVTSIKRVRLSYASFGEGIPILFIPPPVVGSAVFSRQVQYLASMFRVILFELRGHNGIEAGDAPLTYSIIADDVLKLLDALAIDRVVICGYSMGASMALEFMRRFPERTLGSILVSGFSEVTDLRFKTEIRAAMAAAKLHAMRTLSFTLALSNADNPGIFQPMFALGLQCDPTVVRDLFSCALWYNCTADLINMHSPTLLVFGDKDKRLARYARILRTAMPNNQAITIPGVRHQIPTKKYQQLNQHIAPFVLSLNR